LFFLEKNVGRGGDQIGDCEVYYDIKITKSRVKKT
jgi:hypothetical protein